MNYIENTNTILYKDHELFINTQERSNSAKELSANVRVVAYIDQESNNNEDISKLFDIIKACKITPDQVHIISDASAWRNYRNLEHIKEVFILGVAEEQIALNVTFPIHYPYEFDNRTWFKTIALKDLKNSPEAKGALWNKALKPYYIQST